jgi:hypothetical protein
MVARSASPDGAGSFVNVTVYVGATGAGCTTDGVELAVNLLSSDAAGALDTSTRQAAATSNSRRWFGTGDPFP